MFTCTSVQKIVVPLNTRVKQYKLYILEVIIVMRKVKSNFLLFILKVIGCILRLEIIDRLIV